MCTTRSDMVLASLFSSIILSRPSALEPRFSNGLRAVVDEEPLILESEDECPDPSRLGVGVFKRDRGRGWTVGVLLLLLLVVPPPPDGGAVVRGVEVTVVLLVGALALSAAVVVRRNSNIVVDCHWAHDIVVVVVMERKEIYMVNKMEFEVS